MNSEKRSNNWTFVVYPGDSLPDNYLNIIQNWHIPTLLSPIHDKDLNGDLTEKKKHIHIILYFGVGANKSYSQVLEYSKQLNGTIPQIVNNSRALIRYFIHLDNPEKHQYKKQDLITISGFDIGDAFSSFDDENKLYDSIEKIIKDNLIFNYASLTYFLSENGYSYELQFLRKHTMHFNALLNGRYHLLKIRGEL